jgi:membrane-associated phospholipid phosphatase
MQPPVILKRPSLLSLFLALPFRDRAIVAGSLIAACAFFLDPAMLGLARSLDPNARALFRFITDLGKSGWILILAGSAFVCCIALGFRARHRRLKLGRIYVGQAAAFIFVSVAGTGLAASLIKNVIGRARPKLFDAVGSFHFQPFSFHSDFASFPSGHATTIFALATALALLWPRAAIALYTAAVWVALSRVLVGAHYLSDVIAGGALGTLGTLFVRDRFASHRLLFRPSGTACCLRGKRLAEWIGQKLPRGAQAWFALPLDWTRGPLNSAGGRRGPAEVEPDAWDKVSMPLVPAKAGAMLHAPGRPARSL